jgi:hypothetical protein
MKGAEEARIIACATVAEELRHLGVAEERLTVLDFGLHVFPDKLRETLQAEIEATSGDCDILLGYGLCSNALLGLTSSSHRLVVPRVDDCIALFLGSRAEHLRQLSEQPGTYFLTKGWVEAADVPYYEYQRMVERYGEEKARKVSRIMLANYTRVLLIDTGNYHLEEYRDFARAMAELFELAFEEVAGSNRMLVKLIEGDWDDEFLVIEPGEEFQLGDFLKEQGPE